jgi:hypothetical protein
VRSTALLAFQRFLFKLLLFVGFVIDVMIGNQRSLSIYLSLSIFVVSLHIHINQTDIVFLRAHNDVCIHNIDV